MINTKNGRTKALEKYDAVAYYKACIKDGLSGEHCESRELFDKGLDTIIRIELAEEKILREEDIKIHKDLVDITCKTRINVDYVFADTELKRNFLKKILGYSTLKGYKSIDDCPDNQIGVVFKKEYNTALQKIKEYEEWLKEYNLK